MFGDYEAQRHWMEITVNLPVKDWYRNSSVNDLGYWGLDYPPLTAYQSYFHGILLKFFDPASVSLFTSRGYESYIGKLLMRWTVLMSDLMIFFPAVLYFITVYYSGKTTGDRSNMAWHTLMILLNPCIILIDHGHFQYNCISLGLTLAAVAAILSDRNLVGSMLFCLALNHKQMSAYYAPAFFGYLLGKSLRRKNPILEVLKLGFVVLGTFALVWWPYLHSMDASLELVSIYDSAYVVTNQTRFSARIAQLLFVILPFLIPSIMLSIPDLASLFPNYHALGVRLTLSCVSMHYMHEFSKSDDAMLICTKIYQFEQDSKV
ncbi:UNVERIFIED_CONTAM: putative dolichyl pyrophosphate Man9GlcNAc2 alpha-1,3-glucosyltransferase [Sesamum calycinum]|uniref:Alpha-1,3-glucosyltransferase n=1 Tax=Sesamum calycinum TaxID=2727403 RepID=A0AAW2MP21_9LAMI